MRDPAFASYSVSPGRGDMGRPSPQVRWRKSDRGPPPGWSPASRATNRCAEGSSPQRRVVRRFDASRFFADGYRLHTVKHTNELQNRFEYIVFDSCVIDLTARTHSDTGVPAHFRGRVRPMGICALRRVALIRRFA